MLIGFGSISINQGYSQEIGLSTFQESAQGSGALDCARSAHRLGGATTSSERGTDDHLQGSADAQGSPT